MGINIPNNVKQALAAETTALLNECVADTGTGKYGLWPDEDGNESQRKDHTTSELVGIVANFDAKFSYKVGQQEVTRPAIEIYLTYRTKQDDGVIRNWRGVECTIPLSAAGLPAEKGKPGGDQLSRARIQGNRFKGLFSGLLNLPDTDPVLNDPAACLQQVSDMLDAASAEGSALRILTRWEKWVETDKKPTKPGETPRRFFRRQDYVVQNYNLLGVDPSGAGVDNAPANA